MSEGNSNLPVLVATRQQPGAGPSRLPAGRPGRRRALQERQQQDTQKDIIDLTDDRADDDDVQITQVKNVKRHRVSQASPVVVAQVVRAGVVPAVQPPAAPRSPKGYKCVICTDHMEQNMATTTCGHMFCFKCISEWVQKSNTCPTCRAKLTKSKIIRVYPPT